jgi:hypothetical protein
MRVRLRLSFSGVAKISAGRIPPANLIETNHPAKESEGIVRIGLSKIERPQTKVEISGQPSQKAAAVVSNQTKRSDC